jgi:hypothetical protein
MRGTRSVFRIEGRRHPDGSPILRLLPRAPARWSGRPPGKALKDRGENTRTTYRQHDERP